ncbi:hypothetical protein TrLO_g15116 [Triparma laevis f. longispina]|uniref:AGC protein kinase n=1 Tax=Triparma laevis f. longispina TaxID=1714387 RepID=A0A9W7F691_9STRA|nr:hypothetical protein TrLO_g15116 [Triparma laevis f. longispina]
MPRQEELQVRNLDNGSVGNIMESKYSPDYDSLQSKAQQPDSLYDESALKSDADQVEIPRGANLTFSGITEFSVAKDAQSNQYAVYTLVVRSDAAVPPSWRVYRRYQEFRNLSDALRSEGFRVPVLPPKKLIGTLDPDFLMERQSELESWLHQLNEYYQMDEAGAKDPQTSSNYRKFLTQMANQPPFPMERSSGKGGGESKEAEELDANQKVSIDDFKLIKVIGKGSFGKVTLVEHNATGRMFAMKVLKKANVVKRKQVEHTRTERRVLGSINHPFIVHLHFAFQTDAKLFFVLDYCPGGELFFHLSRMKKMPEHMARFYTAEITLALEELHRNGIVYRDLKPENILLDEIGHVKLADFGLAKEGIESTVEGAKSLCGTPEYLSPEILDRKGHGTASDWWNLGMVLFEMLTGLPPWYTTDRQKLFDSLRNAPLTFPYHVSRTAQSIIRGMLTRDPAERLGGKVGAEELKSHPFFAAIDWDALMSKRLMPPFNPCSKSDGKDTANFEREFTNMPTESVDMTRQNRVQSGTFEGFTFEEKSALDVGES